MAGRNATYSCINSDGQYFEKDRKLLKEDTESGKIVNFDLKKTRTETLITFIQCAVSMNYIRRTRYTST